MGPIGLQEMIAIFIIALLLFGPKKLPELGRTLGKALSEFRRAKNELRSTFEGHLRELERETRVDASPKLESRRDSEYASSSPRPPYQSRSYETEAYGSSSTPYEAKTHADHDSAEQAAPSPPEQVEGTVARSNGGRPAKSVSVSAAEEEHSA